MLISEKDALQFLQENDHFLILTHKSPDGDTLGTGFGLLYALRAIGKKADLINSDVIPPKYGYMTEGYAPICQKYDAIVAVDIADEKLFGPGLADYVGKVDLCIDHHPSNCMYAKMTHLVPGAAATAQIIYPIVRALGAPIDQRIGGCIYTGLATDTGCFKFSNTSWETHMVAAELMKQGVQVEQINKVMFGTKTRARIQVEKEVLATMEFFRENTCAMVVIPQDIVKRTGVDESELDGISDLPRQVEGVDIGICIKEKGDELYRVSLRTSEMADASRICALLGGGGHKRAAGCEVRGSLDAVKETLLRAVASCYGDK